MRISIKYKLFFTLFLTSSIVVTGMYFFMQWSFNRGFMNYVNTQDLNNMGRLADNLVAYYRREGSWDAMIGNRRLWQRIEKRSGPAGRDRPPGPGVPRVNDPLRIGPRMALVAADRQTFVVGGENKDIRHLSLRPLELDRRIIGYLALAKPARLADSSDLLYVERQTRIFGIIALTMILVSILLGIPLINHLVGPIKAMIKGAGKLTAGDYRVRLPVTTGDELGRLSADFNLLAATLEKNEKARRQYMADIAHELRTPLAVLQGEIEAVQDGVRAAEPTLAVLHHEVLHLNRLVGDLAELSLSDLGALSYRRQRLDPVVAVEQAVELYSSRLAERDITLTTKMFPAGTLALNADPNRLQQLIANLLENSLRYTDPGGRVEVELGRDGKNLRLVLKDSAPGVNKEQRKKLFDRFYRVDTSRSRSRGGSGLGLAICRNIVEAHQGKIEVQDSPLGGLQVVITFPLIRQEDGYDP
jgi:two-component system sensor histidine kinase BaeS